LAEGRRAAPAIRRPPQREPKTAPIADANFPRADNPAADLAATDVGPDRPEVALPTFAYLYRSWYGHVVRWLGNLGAPRADIEDLAQDVFLVVRRRLDDFDGRNAAGWLYRIASGQVRQHRRRVFFRALVPSRETVELDE